MCDMTTGQQNKGFTLVELIVAVVITAFVAINLLILSGTGFKLHRNTKLSAQTNIEAQLLMNNVKKTIQESKDFSYKDNLYIFTVAENEKVVYALKDDSIYYTDYIDDTTDYCTSENYLGQYISDLEVNGNQSYTKDDKMLVKVKINAEKNGIKTEATEFVRLRNSK